MSFSAIGHDLNRLDGVGKATGQVVFTGDLELPRMLHGAILRSPHPQACVVHVDVARAASVVGVKAVVTGADAPRKKYGAIPDESMEQIKVLALRFALSAPPSAPD